VELIKLREDLVVCDVLVIENTAFPSSTFMETKSFTPAWRRTHRSRQIDANTFHVGLAQAHHHKAGKQKEHDIDQWNDLDARSFSAELAKIVS
jgi:hypothetical protein